VKLILFGVTGLVGSSVLREALMDASVEAVLSIGRSTCNVTNPKLKELIMPDLFDITSVAQTIAGYDACIWAIGISSVGLNEAVYAEVTETLTLKWANELLRSNPEFSFCYCSAGGAGGRSMWARVRQRVEGEIKTMGFLHAGVVRPGFIKPGQGLRSKTRAYHIGAVLLNPFFPFFARVLPSLFTTSERLGRAMLRIVEGHSDKFIVEYAEINRVGATS
jgi:hypothetical protein